MTEQPNIPTITVIHPCFVAGVIVQAGATYRVGEVDTLIHAGKAKLTHLLSDLDKATIEGYQAKHAKSIARSVPLPRATETRGITGLGQPPSTDGDYATLNLQKLHAELEARNITYGSRVSKAELIALLVADDTAKSEAA
jgi:hypothetical protein